MLRFFVKPFSRWASCTARVSSLCSLEEALPAPNAFQMYMYIEFSPGHFPELDDVPSSPQVGFDFKSYFFSPFKLDTFCPKTFFSSALCRDKFPAFPREMRGACAFLGGLSGLAARFFFFRPEVKTPFFTPTSILPRPCFYAKLVDRLLSPAVEVPFRSLGRKESSEGRARSR